MIVNKEQLKDFVKQTIRESLTEREYQSILNEVSPPGKKAEKMIHHVKASLRKAHPDWSEDKITGVAIATGWKAHNKGSVEENKTCTDDSCELSHCADCGCHVAGGNVGHSVQCDACKDGLREVATNIPKGTLAKLNPNIADKGKKVKMKLPSSKKINENKEESPDHSLTDKIVSKIIKRGITDVEKIKNLASQLFLSTYDRPGDMDVIDDSIRKQLGGVNEAAYKTQGPSLRTFDDSPQFPEVWNDPTKS